MNDSWQIFLDLIQIALGTRGCLNERPAPQQWQQVYDMAEKQSLLGVCFSGIQKISDSDTEDYCGMSELQYQKWRDIAAQIQHKNELVNSQCVLLQNMLAKGRLRSCILKGQGVALSYPEGLRKMRQSGDIDVWVDAPREVTLAWAEAHGMTERAGDLHVGCDLFSETPVEIHFTPSVISGRRRNRMLQDWFKIQKDACMTNKVGSIVTPTSEFNLVYLMQHMFRHYLYEGIGLRHVMDYYMALQSVKMIVPQQTKEIVRIFGMEKFAGALMWVLHQVFGCDTVLELPWEPDENRGRRLLEVILEGGNFGHSTEKYKVTGWNKPFRRICRFARRNWYLFRDYPKEILINITKKIFLQ